MVTSGKTKQSRLEKLIGNKIKKVKPRHERLGYIKQLVINQYELIQSALDRGCDFDDIAEVISEEIGRNVSANTLKRYHLANRRSLQEDDEATGINNQGEDYEKTLYRQKRMKAQGDNSRSINTSTVLDSPPESSEQKSLKDRLSNYLLDNNNFEDDEDTEGYNIY